MLQQAIQVLEQGGTVDEGLIPPVNPDDLVDPNAPKPEPDAGPAPPPVPVGAGGGAAASPVPDPSSEDFDPNNTNNLVSVCALHNA